MSIAAIGSKIAMIERGVTIAAGMTGTIGTMTFAVETKRSVVATHCSA